MAEVITASAYQDMRSCCFSWRQREADATSWSRLVDERRQSYIETEHYSLSCRGGICRRSDALVLRGRLAAATQSGLGLSQARRMTVLFAAHSYAAPRTCISHCSLQTIPTLALTTRAASPAPSRPARTPIATTTLRLRQR
jgi:hypothetical protein